jgi:cyanophycinase-like exopeptidase
MTMPRLLAIMGSGEIAPTMAKVHRMLFARLGDPGATGVILDTPYGFQENADDLSERTIAFFRESVGRTFEVARLRSRTDDPVDEATAVARIRAAAYVMAGPGSPSYALRQWAGGAIPGAIAARLRDGGVVTMASAAALTLGVATIPVYEVYKVGEEPRWLDGLDLLGAATGLRAAVVPHYDNAEGGTHDTRFCYMGERRLRMLERQLPDGAFILGVDGHTAAVFDLDRRTAAIFGRGGLTIRAAGRSLVLAAGREVPIDALAEAAADLAAGGGAASGLAAVFGTTDGGGGIADEPGPRDVRDARDRSQAEAALPDRVAALEGAALAAIDTGPGREVVTALLELDDLIEAHTRAGEDSPDLDGARSTFRALIARFGETAVPAAGGSGPDGSDASAALEALLEPLLELRDRARAAGDWAVADDLRSRLEGAGIEIRDEADGATWRLREPSSR